MGCLAMRWSGSMRRVVRLMKPVIEHRLGNSQAGDHITINQVCSSRQTPRIERRGSNPKQDCLQWLIELSRVDGEPSVTDITQKALGFIFAFAHQIAMVSLYLVTDD